MPPTCVARTAPNESTSKGRAQMKFLVLGGGKQGSACALELARRDEVEKVIIADLDASDLPPFLAPWSGSKVEPRNVDATDEAQVRTAMDGVDAVACALPYYFNVPMTRLAIEAGAHFCDLGGNTELVDEQKGFHDDAVAACVSVVPDCGLAPGMVNILAQGGIDAMDHASSVQIFVGGLPQKPRPPLNYQIVYSMEGVLDYYTTPVLVLENGEVREKEALTEIEEVDFPEPIGRLEAFLTAGGISRMPYRYQGAIPSMTYKTLRYPGHAALMKAMRDIGLMDLEPIDVKGRPVVPRDAFIAAVSPGLRNPDGNDLVVMRVVVRGTKDDAPRTVTYDMVDYYDTDTGVTAMMRTTGYSLAATARLQAGGAVDAGVHTPSECVPVDAYVRALADCGVTIERSES
jgi:lysine 6-dehydrogenase